MKNRQDNRVDGIKTLKTVLRSWLAIPRGAGQARLPRPWHGHEWFFVSTELRDRKQRTRNEEPGTKAALGAAFTIIELLIVMCIIAILLGFALPSFLSMKDKARQRKAVITAKHLELAFNEYYNQNQSWPPSDSGDLVKGAVLNALIGATGGIAYFEIGINTADTFYDPWGNGFYHVAFDDNFDNQVTAPDGATISKSVIVWSLYTCTNNQGQVITITNKSWE